jgi:hypothetical protein
MRPTLPPRRTLPLLLLSAALLLSGCGSAGSRNPNGATAPSGPVAGGSAPSDPAPGAVAVKAGGGAEVQAVPRFQGSIVAGRGAVRERVRSSWRRGCPVGPVELRLLRVDQWGLDGRVHRGELIVHRDHARRILIVLEKLFKAGYQSSARGLRPSGRR